ncbi:MAG: sigma-70 family RNA polymerase sigma factor [Planctomycetota bacterium]
MELERYRELAYGTALALLGDHHLAEDAVQEAFLEAGRSWDRVREPDKRAAWVRGIVRHRCYRQLRRRDRGFEPLPERATDFEPWERAAQREAHDDLLARVRALPRPMREVVVLHYLRGCPQREVAGFLGLPVTTVNNRLHAARQLLKGGTMTFDTPEVGTITRADGAIVEARFEPDAQPDVFDALARPESEPSLRVIQTLEDGAVRCLLLAGDAPAVGQRVVNRTARAGTYTAKAAGDDDLRAAVAALGEPCEGFVETGIKPIDLFCPLPRRGNIALFGTAGTGKMVLTHELHHRLQDGPRIFYQADRSEPALIRDLRADDDTVLDIPWILSDRATDPEYAATDETFDVRIYTTPLLAIRAVWPAVDPFHSRSRVVVSERHTRVSGEARALLESTRAERTDAVLLEYLACRAWGAARRRLAARAEPASVEARRADRLESFLTTPFFTAGDMGAGIHTPLDQTLDGVEAILRGDCDDRDPASLRYIATL